MPSCLYPRDGSEGPTRRALWTAEPLSVHPLPLRANLRLGVVPTNWEGAACTMITVEGLGVAYRGGKRAAVRGISFHIEQGEIFGFLGPSGAGKSTTQKVLIRLLRDYQGTAHVLGRDLREWGTGYYRQVGVSFELPSHYRKLTALENLQFFRALHGGPTGAGGHTDDPGELLHLVGLGEDMNRRLEEFSKGMQMRLNFARALLHRPTCLFLDEPTIGLDPVHGRQVMDLVRDRRRDGATVFLTTHDMSVADALCDRVGFIVDGELREVAAPTALKQRYGRRAVRVEVDGDAGPEPFEFDLDGLGENAQFLELLRSRHVRTIHSVEPSLADIFIEVTGRHLQ